MFTIRTIIENCLYALSISPKPADPIRKQDYADESEYVDEFSQLFVQWSDVSWLYTFFEQHKADLFGGFFSAIDSVEEAVSLTLDEAESLENKLLDLAQAGVGAKYIKL